MINVHIYSRLAAQHVEQATPMLTQRRSPNHNVTVRSARHGYAKPTLSYGLLQSPHPWGDSVMAKKKSSAARKAKSNARHAIWRVSRKEELRAYHATWRVARKEEIKAKSVAYYAENREQILVKNAAYTVKNRERIKAKRAAYYAAHKEDSAKRMAAWRAAHPDLCREYTVRKRARKANAPISDFTVSQWKAMQEFYDHRCVYCGKRYKGKLTQDHIQPLSKGGSHTLSNIVPACVSCNCKKQAGPVLAPVQPLLLVDVL